ncbi:nucleotidyltransferase family protein [Roseomonas eburnea]|uniref:Nucleotidyltransferase family protein n=1 Tax=Neoroseomonas eburnea TaxID=1346889 RepID=A0A9X9XEN9_9PROT|nr:nucleotidyltransferase family protein [Neoroseomonas eburnea]MBR0682175.1 nucleotidyltransferase family protein [Neoroseomonas eburnea]
MRDAADLARFVAGRPAMLDRLATVAAHGPPHAWIGAGFLRNAVWDALTGRDPDAIPPADLDVVFHDAADASPERDAAAEAALSAAAPGLPWSVANQARMHARNGHAPYRDLAEALAHWPETATAVAARLGPRGVEILAPHGLEDLFALIARPTPAHRAQPAAMLARIAAKAWTTRWPALRLLAE